MEFSFLMHDIPIYKNIKQSDQHILSYRYRFLSEAIRNSIGVYCVKLIKKARCLALMPNLTEFCPQVPKKVK